MKLMDEKGRLFGKISMIDLLVILVVLMMALALLVKTDRLGLIGGKTDAVEDRIITFQVQLRGVEDYVVAAILEGEEIYDANYASNKRAVGKVTQVEVTQSPGAVIEALDDGTAGPVEMEGTVDALVTVESSGTQDGDQWIINGVYRLGVNSARTYYSRRAQFTGTVADIWADVQ